MPFPLPRLLALGALLSFALPSPAAEKISFNRDVRPILSDTCFACHGPDEKKRDSGLRLDLREEAIATRDGVRAIVPGHPEQSEAFLRLTTTDKEDVMPPAKTHKTITPAHIATIKRWIEEGAEYQPHWAFVAPQRPEPARVENGVVRNPIDSFILERLAREGWRQSPEADRPTLIRRVTLDLTGMPPTAEEVSAFLADQAPTAYEKLVDRLLASPRYGEQMAVPWLDFARYADSNGFQSDTSRHMWPWRDWVIDAFNSNMPFDRFTVEQLAGDMLPKASTPEATRAQITASGFNRNCRLNGEGGRIVDEWFVETVIDRVETTGLTWLGLTVGCARCHDHKYDPISQKEFYQLFAFFNSSDELGVMDEFGGSASTRKGGNSKPVLEIPSPEQAVQLTKLEMALEAAQARLAGAQKQPAPVAKAQPVQPKASGDAWEPLSPTEVKSVGGADFARLEDGTWLASGTTPANDTYIVTAPLAQGILTGLLLDVLPDESLPNQSLGRSSNGNFVLTGLEAEIAAPSLPKPMKVQFTHAEADFAQENYDVKQILEPGSKKGLKKGWAIGGHINRAPHQAVFATDAPVSVPPQATMTIRFKHESQFARHSMGRFGLQTTALPLTEIRLTGAPFSNPLAAAPKAQGPVAAAEGEIASLKQQIGKLKATFNNVMVMKELPQPRDAFILKRGEYDKKGEKVTRGLLAALPPLPAGEQMNRLGLARWIASPTNPLTARVWVNRAWEKFFGLGLVRTSENLGSQAEWPSHPELLDWLATEFMRIGWDMKALQKTMVMSATYRQSSRVTPELIARDSENRLLARGPRFRMSAEMIRDQALAFSGLLVEQVGGPSVRPYMPNNVWDETSKYGDMRNYKAGTGADLYRRSLYTIWKRTAAPPSMTMFDSPTREICTVKRSRTNTPLQALALLNEVTYVEAARVLAERMLTLGGQSPQERVTWAFQKVTCRPPNARELEVLTAGLAKRLAALRTQPEVAGQLVAAGSAPLNPALPPAELAAYTVTANVLLNLDEVVTRE